MLILESSEFQTLHSIVEVSFSSSFMVAIQDANRCTFLPPSTHSAQRKGCSRRHSTLLSAKRASKRLGRSSRRWHLVWPAGAGYGHLNGYAISHCTPGALILIQVASPGCLIHPCLKGMPQCALTDSCTQILVTYHRLWEAHRICRLDKCNPGKVN